METDTETLTHAQAIPNDPPGVPAQLVRLATPGETAALTFPETGYVGVAAKFAEVHSQRYESPKEFFYIDMLGILGTVLSGRVRADFDLACQPRLYVLKIATSAWRRKSTSTHIADKFVKGVLEGSSNPPDHQSLIVYGVGSAEGLGTRLQAYGDTRDVLGTGSITRRAVLVMDEFRRFEAKSNVQGSALRPMLNELYESNEYENLTKDRSLHIPDGHLGFLSNTTEETYTNLLQSAESIDIGLLNRLFLVIGGPGKRIARPKAPPEAELAPIREELRRYLESLPQLMHGRAEHEIIIHLTRDADAMWTDWYDRIEETPETARLDNLGMRLMGLLAFTSGQKQIDTKLMRSVLDLLEYQRQVRVLYKPNEGANPTARMEEAIRRLLAAKGPLSDRDLQRLTNAHRAGLQVYKDAIEAMESVQEIVFVARKYKLVLPKP